MIAESIELSDKTAHTQLSMLIALQGAVVLQADHNPPLAVEFGEESLDLTQASNSPETILQALQGLGHSRRHSGDLDGAEAALRQALKLEAEMSGRHASIGVTELLYQS